MVRSVPGGLIYPADAPLVNNHSLFCLQGSGCVWEGPSLTARKRRLGTFRKSRERSGDFNKYPKLDMWAQTRNGLPHKLNLN